MQTMEHHFTRIARKYNDIRTTDHEPIEYIRDFLSRYERCYALDVGCGPGRYALLLLQHMPQLHLCCVDQSGSMIKETTRLLRAASVDRFKGVTADASKLPFDQDSVDVVFTFNAIHHFIMPAFLREASRVLKTESYIVIYTRLPSQNESGIWGKYFPDFNCVERRLYSLDDIDAAILRIPGLALDTVKLFRFERVSSLERLIEKARSGHYSTFRLYKKERFEECIREFRESLQRNFPDTKQIRWTDGNVLLIVKTCERSQ